MQSILFTQTIKDNIQLDDFLEKNGFSKKNRHLLKMEKRIFVNHQLVMHNIDLYPNDQIEINCAKEEKSNLLPLNKPIRILYEDNVVFIVDKPIHLIVHDDGNAIETLDRMVAHYFNETHQLCPVHAIHRLDKDTSGCIFYCKQSYLQPYFDQALRDKRIQRTYLALVEGKIERKMTICQKIGKDRHQNRYRISKNGLEATTHLWPIRTFHDKTLIQCQLETGRRHQIRVHLASIGHPLIGDALYGHPSSMRCALHSHTLTFFHPILQKNITVVSKLPIDMRQCMK